MQNIRLSIDLLKVDGARICRFPNAANVATDYVCIPVSKCFIPSERPRPYFMATAIHCPNAKYGDFMIKPYLSADDYKHLSKEEQRATPIIGKGSFMTEATNKAIAAMAETIQVVESELKPATDQPETGGSAAQCFNAPSPAGGRNELDGSQLSDFWVYSPQGWQTGFPTFNSAAGYASDNCLERNVIIEMKGNLEIARWHWNESQIDWVKSVNKKRMS